MGKKNPRAAARGSLHMGQQFVVPAARRRVRLGHRSVANPSSQEDEVEFSDTGYRPVWADSLKQLAESSQPARVSAGR
jgi:hypothetical protein